MFEPRRAKAAPTVRAARGALAVRAVRATVAIVLAVMTVSSIPLPARAQPAPATKALVGGTLIDGNGGPPLHDSVILIEGERIRAVGTVETLTVPPDADVISTEGMSVLPGLWDMHVHLMIAGHADYAHWDRTYPDRFESVIMPASARQLLLAGVTSARDLGAPLEASIAVRDAINAGRIPGPTLYVSGPFIQHEPYPGTELFRWGVDGADDARANVRRLAEAGVDVIKLIDQDQMTMEEVNAVVDEAHRHGLPVTAHAHRPAEIRRGLLAGVDGFEHTGLAIAPDYPEDILEMLRDRAAQGNRPPLFWTPTIEVLFNYEYTRDQFLEKLDDPCRRAGLPDEIVADIDRSLLSWDRLPYFSMMAARRPTLGRKFNALRSTGTVLLIGTDSGIPGEFHCQSTWNELDIWVNRLGMPPMEAIRAATYWPAVAMGVADDVGTIEPGKYADIIAVRGDVLRYISLLQDVDLVIKKGVRYDRPTPSRTPLPNALPPAASNSAPSGTSMPAMSATAADTTLVLIVRHAERVSDAPNSDLSDIGLARADRLAALAAEAGVQAVYATDFCRAAQTAQAAAEVLGLPIRVVATGNASAGLDGCSPGIDARRDRVEEPTPDGVARRVLREQRGGTVLVVGHSNTVPAIAEALGATVCPTLIQPDERGRCWLADDSYDKLFIIRVPTIDGGTARVQLSTIDPP